MTASPDTPFMHPRVAAGVLFIDDMDRVLLMVRYLEDGQLVTSISKT